MKASVMISSPSESWNIHRNVTYSRELYSTDNRFTNITIYEMRHFTLIRELLTFFQTFYQRGSIAISARIYGLFTPSSVRPLDVSPSGRFALWTIRPLDVSHPGRFALWTFRPQDVTPPGRFAPWTFRTLDVLPPCNGRFAPLTVSNKKPS